jgi:hypothetical protein
MRSTSHPILNKPSRRITVPERKARADAMTKGSISGRSTIASATMVAVTRDATATG